MAVETQQVSGTCKDRNEGSPLVGDPVLDKLGTFGRVPGCNNSEHLVRWLGGKEGIQYGISGVCVCVFVEDMTKSL
jgi:hypothetical protein